MRTPRDSHNRGLSASPKGNFLPSKSIDWAKNSMSHNPSGVAYFGKSKTPPTIKGRLNITHFKCVRSSGHQSPCGAPVTFFQLWKFCQLCFGFFVGCLKKSSRGQNLRGKKVRLAYRARRPSRARGEKFFPRILRQPAKFRAEKILKHSRLFWAKREKVCLASVKCPKGTTFLPPKNVLSVHLAKSRERYLYILI